MKRPVERRTKPNLLRLLSTVTPRWPVAKITATATVLSTSPKRGYQKPTAVVCCGHCHDDGAMCAFDSDHFSKPRTVEAGVALQTGANAQWAATTMLRVCLDGVAFLRNLWQRFQCDVLESHGIHISRSVRDAATVLFWLPDIVFDERLLEGSWSPAELADRCSSLPEVLAFVQRQVTVFE